MKARFAAILSLLGAGFIAGIGTTIFLELGLYDLSALSPHNELERQLIMFLKNNAIEYQSGDIKAPALNDRERIKKGFALYEVQCKVCHGAPGEPRGRVSTGLNPNPPPLFKADDHWSSGELGWIIQNGLKMAGMPGVGIGQTDDDIWNIVSYVKRMNTLSVAEYKAMKKALKDGVDPPGLEWEFPEEGWKKLKNYSASEGKVLLKKLGCASCHSIPGIKAQNTHAGPSLKEWKNRHFIAGQVANYPKNLVKWLMHPEKIDPTTLMPNLDVTEEQAWKMSAYLMSLEE